jgi:hypothetical protein
MEKIEKMAMGDGNQKIEKMEKITMRWWQSEDPEDGDETMGIRRWKRWR